ncbi:hypothetical protein ANANG_G00022780 [Anguilla anguilla]|uniref:Uncharacterized protein n=1 Tax=Anguilla anguilla TaxID=7936 RepID=A0A9D3S6S5_ANGAN|nr:hypothetical protein ANANG_G00022780 [Anguilla anguilla]
MALFPAFAGLSSGNSNNEKQSKGLDWLNNQSFSTDEALSLHRRAIEQTEPGSQNSEISSPAVQKHRNEDEEDAKAKKRKKKEKKKKQKKHKKRSKAESESSGSESDTVYPSDLLKQATDPCRQEEEEECVSGSFVWLDDLQTPTDRPFCIDRKADPANWEYRSLYRADIARYRRKGSSALGLNPKTQSVSWAEPGSEKKKTDRKADRKSERYFSRGARQLLGSRGLPARPSVPGPGASLVAAHFIPVPPCVRRRGKPAPGAPPGSTPWGCTTPPPPCGSRARARRSMRSSRKRGPRGPPGTAAPVPSWPPAWRTSTGGCGRPPLTQPPGWSSYASRTS